MSKPLTKLYPFWFDFASEGIPQNSRITVLFWYAQEETATQRLHPNLVPCTLWENESVYIKQERTT
jgi:hypothetical protein